MGDIRQFLEALDLGQYSTVFVENEIDVRDLPELSEVDLKDLGLPLGPRRRILAAIRDMGSVAPPDQAPASHPAERRQIAVLFCDLVGSTAMSAELDPEDLRDLIQRYQDVVSAEIVRYGGFVAKFLGDGVLAYFGYPTAHEEGTERAIRAGLGIVAEIRDRQAEMVGATGTSINTRIGIESGLVVIGDMIGETASEVGAIVGETPNLASRLESVASPGEIVIGPAARRLAGYAFRLKDRGPQILKGMTKPVRAWTVAGDADTEGRFEATRGPNLTPFVGRDAELSLLMEKWDDACAGEGRVVFVSGEAGIGKSRLTQVLRERLREVPHTRLNYQCSPYHTSTALHPILRQFEWAAGFAVVDDLETKLDKLEVMIAPGPMVTEAATPLFAAMLGLAAGDRWPPLVMTPQKQKAETLKALADQVAALAETQPVLLIFEDAHWIDPTSQEAIEVLAARIPDQKTLLVVTHRPEYAPPFGMQAMGHVSSISLARLGRRQSTELAAHVSGGGELSDETLTEIVTRTDGVPLFLEELTKTVLETGAKSTTAIPTTLNDSLMVRLNRLSPMRETAQIAACIGREFNTDLLAAVCPLGDAALGDALDELVRNELIFRTGTGYMFKHALVQMAAYESLLKSRRQELHGKIARALEEGFPDIAANEPEVIAHHFGQAKVADRAIDYLRKAGELASHISAHAETVAHLSKALAILETLPESPERSRNELDLLTKMGPALFATRGSTSEVEANHRRAFELAQELGESLQKFAALQGLWFLHHYRSELKKSKIVAEQMVELAIGQHDSMPIISSHRCLGYSLHVLGELDRARSELEFVISGYDPEAHADFASRQSGSDPGAGSMCQIAWVLFALGYPDQAVESSQKGLKLAERLAHPFSITWAHTAAAALHQWRGDTQATFDHATAALEIAEEKAMTVYVHWLHVLHGWALFERDCDANAIIPMREAVAALEAMGAFLVTPYFGGILTGSALGKNGRVHEALDLVNQTLARIDLTEERLWEAELHRMKGQLLLEFGAGKDAEAEACFLKAIEVAGAQKAKSWELRAATSLARLQCDQGRRDEARNLLARVYGWFTEGFGTPDLKAAKVLLDEMSTKD